MAHDYISYGFAALVLFGGVMGYLRKGSVMSLVMGTIAGSLLLYGAYQLSENPNNLYLTLGVSLVLMLVMGMRFVNTGRFMPAGLTALFSLFMTFRLGTRLYNQ